MAWRDELRRGSFRGIAFETTSTNMTIGRRLARHEYPQRDLPYMEDMGRKAREYRFDAFIIGADYMALRDALIDAIEESGAGQLIHPYYGSLQVTITDCQLNESTEYGGTARFNITFVEAGQQIEPDSATDTELVLETQTEATNTAIADDFETGFSIEDTSDYVAADALDLTTSFLALPSMALGQLDSIRADIENPLKYLLPENIASSLSIPNQFAQSIQALINQATSLSEIFNFTIEPIAAQIVTPSRELQNDNRIALNNLFQQSASVKQIQTVATSSVETIDDAIQAKAEIVELADAMLLNETTQQSTASEVIQLRTDATSHFASLTDDLPRLVPVTFQQVLPAVVIVHEWYGDDWYDDGREDDFISRNKVAHPGFVNAGQPVYLLS